MVVTAAKEKGRELYAELSLEERKQKLDGMVVQYFILKMLLNNLKIFADLLNKKKRFPYLF